MPKITIYLNEKNNTKINNARGPIKVSTVINKVFEVIDENSIRSWCNLPQTPTQLDQNLEENRQ